VEITPPDNTELVPPLDPSAGAGPEGSRFPADYYSDPTLRTGNLPKWVPMGCGLLSIGALVILLALGNFFLNDGLPTILGFVFSNIEDELDKQFDSTVSAAEREGLKHELDALASAVSKRRVSAPAATRILRDMQSTIEDKRVTREETGKLTSEIRGLLQGVEPAPR